MKPLAIILILTLNPYIQSRPFFKVIEQLLVNSPCDECAIDYAACWNIASNSFSVGGLELRTLSVA